MGRKLTFAVGLTVGWIVGVLYICLNIIHNPVKWKAEIEKATNGGA